MSAACYGRLYDSTMFHGIVGEVVLRRYALQSTIAA
jgi:hypothetical protein